MQLTFASIVLSFAFAVFLVLKELVRQPNTGLWNPATFGFWLRQLVALAVLGFAPALTQVFIIERLTALYRDTQRLVMLEQQQRLALEAPGS